MRAAVIVLIGGGVGLLAAAVLEAVLGGLTPAGTPWAAEVSIDGRVAVVALAGSLLTGLLVGLVPAWRAASPGRTAQLRDGSRSSAGRRASRLNGAVIVETIFGWPGVGKLMIDSIFDRDFAVLQASILVTATAIFIVNIAIDIAYAVLDPRIRYN